eukprot:COSAG02_NODE_8_length_60691_cov_104.994752_4_plen_56_part_00
MGIALHSGQQHAGLVSYGVDMILDAGKGRLSWVGHSFALRMLPTVTSENHSLCQS